MNFAICEKCRRFGGSRKPDERGKSWLCAGLVWKQRSEVIPNHSYWEGNKYVVIRPESVAPPSYCDFGVIQVMIGPDEEIPSDFREDERVFIESKNSN